LTKRGALAWYIEIFIAAPAGSMAWPSF